MTEKSGMANPSPQFKSWKKLYYTLFEKKYDIYKNQTFPGEVA